jgi:hypothetical protein
VSCCDQCLKAMIGKRRRYLEGTTLHILQSSLVNQPLVRKYKNVDEEAKVT